MGTNCVPLVADLFLFCYERGFMLSLSDDNQSIAFNSTSRYLDDLLNIDNTFFDRRMSQIPRPHFWIYIYLYQMLLLRV